MNTLSSPLATTSMSSAEDRGMPASGTSAQSGPPYLCPSCQKSYSRLEYLRRHERRHADIRPFVCDCGKGFSRSDVLSRHKRQCAVHLHGEDPVEEPKSRRMSQGRGKRPSGAGRNSGRQNSDENQLSDPLADVNDGGISRRPFEQASSHPNSFSTQSTSFPFPPQVGMQQNSSAPPPLLPPAPYTSEGGGLGATTSGSPFGGAMSHHLSALNNLVNQQHNYPSSPESNGTLSQHSSPRFSARDMSRHGSNGSRFSLRKSGGSFDHLGPRSASMNQSNSQQYAPEFWEALDPAAKSASSISGTDYVNTTSGTSQPSLNLNDSGGSNAFGTPGGAISNGITTPRGEPTRFAVSTGPLSPFSSIALSSTMSPYLSAFSNARDTPFVASPSRGLIPGTPGSSLNVFDWTMRPPSKPASTSAKRDNASGHATQQPNQQTGQGLLSSSPPSSTSTKRKRDEDDDSRRSPQAQTDNLDADQRSAAELLDSLRNSGQRTPVQAPLGSSGPSQPLSVSTATNGAAEPSPAPKVEEVSLESSAEALKTASAADGTTSPSTSSSPRMTSMTRESGETRSENVQSFFEPRNAPMAPEVFQPNLHLNMQQEHAGGFVGHETQSSVTTTDKELSHLPRSSQAVSPGTWDAIVGSDHWFAGSQKTDTGLSPELASIGDVFSNYGDPQLLTQSSVSNWLASPSVQQLISLFSNTPVSQPNLSMTSNALGGVIREPPAVQISTSPPLPSEDMAAEVSTLALERALADVKNPFYIPSSLFRACYSVPHWNLPPVTRLSVLALHAQQNLLKHIPIIHEPTFRLDTTPGCLAFAMCMLGCHEHGRKWWAGLEVVPSPVSTLSVSKKEGSPVHPSNEYSESGDQFEGDLMQVQVDEEDGEALVRPIVMSEKTDMLIRSFAKRARTEKDKVSVVQALVLFQATRFLSSDSSTRSMAAMVHPTIVAMARNAGIFDVHAVHSDRQVYYSAEDAVRSTIFESSNLSFGYSFLPTYIPGCSDDEKLWRRWSELAGRRRTAFTIFAMDSVAHMDAGITVQVVPHDLEHLPLPSPDSIWRAPNTEIWKQALEKYRGPTFGDAMRELFASPTGLDWGREENSSIPSIRGRHGPFARLSLVLALLRGVIHSVDGHEKGIPSASPLQMYIQDARGSASDKVDGQSFPHDTKMLVRALHRWRQAWDQDYLCLIASGPAGYARMQKLTNNNSDMSFLGDHHLFSSQTASRATALVDDALPFYWLARLLISNVEDEVEAQRDGTYDSLQKLRAMLTEGQEIPLDARQAPFKTLLRTTKTFVDKGERT